jgi:Bacterial Ig-like domain (group 3)
MNGITIAGIRSRLPGRKHTAATAAIALAAVGLVGGALAAALPAAAASATGSCTTSAGQVTCTFTSPGTGQSITIPATVSSVSVTLVGGQGGENSVPYGEIAAGGDGAVVTATLDLGALGAGGPTTLGVDVGGAGEVGTGGVNGGGSAAFSDVGAASSTGGGGGGATDITFGGSTLLVAGGGGGAGPDGNLCSASGGGPIPGGAGGNADDGGYQGGDDTSGSNELVGGGGGGAGTSSQPGSGGSAGTGTSTDPCGGSTDAGKEGASGSGRDGGNGTGLTGGGGGGGYFGGGAGGGGASGTNLDSSGGGGGGGGSSYTGGTGISDASVNDAGNAGTINGGNGEVIISYPALAITTISLPDGTAGTAYTDTLAAVNGTSPYSWSLASGSSLPSGLTLSPGGVISGTPQAGGTFSFTVQVTDSTSPTPQTATEALSLTVGPATPQLVLSASPTSGNATVDTPVTLTATVLGVAGVTTPSGSVTFGGSAASCGTVSLVSGAISCQLGDLAAGSYSFTASYSGDANYAAVQQATLSGYPVSLLTQSVSFSTNPPATADYGGSYTPAASATSGLPVTFSIDSTSTTGACALNAPTGVVSFTGTGTCVIDAAQAGSSVYGPAQAQQSVTIAPAATTTTVAVTATALTATVTALPPGGGTPAGTVTFTVGGTTAGTAALNASGVATLPFASSGAETVAAAYAGNADYLASSASTATTNPVITANVVSRHPASKYGWYRSPVTVSFACTPGSAPLTGPCPGPVTLTRNGADQVVSRTITDADGGTATVSVVVSIDQTKPKVTVTGIRNNATYDAPGPAKIGCRATEKISGLAAPCKVTVHRTAAAITWTATATSKAGITTTVHGKASLVDLYVAGTQRRDGRYLVTVGRTDTVIAYLPGTKAAPRYIYAAPQGVKPHPVGPAMKKIGAGLYAIRTTITTRMDRKYENWTLGILAGHSLHIVQITLQK